MKIAIGIVVVLIVALVAILAIAATKPDTVRVERKAVMKAPAESVFALINDFHRWSAWSPYEKLDPASKKTYSGASSGKGAVYEWDGNDKAGKGRMEITDTRAPEKVTIKLDFEKPFEGHNVAQFTMEPQGELTNVTWSMEGPRPYMMKVVSIFLDLDSLIGKDFEAGLANIKAIVEK